MSDCIAELQTPITFAAHATLDADSVPSFESMIDSFSKESRLSPLMRQRDVEVQDILLEYGLSNDSDHRQRSSDVLVDPERKTISFFRTLSVDKGKIAVEVSLLSKDESEKDAVINALRKATNAQEIILHSFRDQALIEKYDRELSSKGPSGTFLESESNLEICVKLLDPALRGVVKKIAQFGEQYLPYTYITKELTKDANEQEAIEKTVSDNEITVTRFAIQCKGCRELIPSISFSTEESAENIQENSSFKCQYCNSKETEISKVLSVRESVTRAIEDGIWLKYMAYKLVEPHSEKVWRGVLDTKGELDVVSVANGKSILVECKDASFGQNDLYNLVAKSDRIDPDIVLVVTSTEMDPNVRKSIDRYNKRNQTKILVLEGDTDKISQESSNLFSGMRQEYVRNIIALQDHED